jgi:formylglycine-generating enzyme required for sulfatase activity
MSWTDFPQIFGVILKGQSEVKQFTAFLVDDIGHLLTVAHPFVNEQVQKVSCENQLLCFEATPIFISDDVENHDFALLKADTSELKQIKKVGNLQLLSNEPVIGSKLFGSGFGEYFDKIRSRKPVRKHSSEFYGTLGSECFFNINISTGRHVVPGDSGSPLFSVNENKVVGLNDARYQKKIEDVKVRRGHLLPLTKISEYLKTKNRDEIHRIIFPKFKHIRENDSALDVISLDYMSVKSGCKGFFNRLFFRFKSSTYKYEKALQQSGAFDHTEINRLLEVFKNYITLQYTLSDNEDADYFDFQRSLKTELENLRGKQKFYLLLGESGTGKTTALQFLFARMTTQKSRYKVIYYSCADDLTPVFSLPDKIKKRTILLLDSFDEAPDAFRNYGEFFTEIEENTHQFAKVLIACRKQFFASSEDIRKKTNNRGKIYDYQHIFLSLIEETEIQKYVARIYEPGAPDNRYGKALEIIRKSGNLMVRPMILQFIDAILRVFEGRMSDTITSYDVYKVIVNEWLGREEKVLKETAGARRNMLKLTNEIALSAYQSYLYGSEKPHHLSVSRLRQLFGVDDAEELILRDRSLLKRTADHRYSLVHRTFKEYFLANLIYDGIISEQSLDKAYFADTWQFYKEMCNTLMASVVEMPEPEPLLAYKEHIAETIPCFAIHAYVHHVWKIAGITSLPEVYNGILKLNEINDGLRDALIDLAESMVKSGSYSFNMSDLVHTADTYSIYTEDIENLPFILQRGNEFHFIHNSLAEYLCLYELLTETSKEDFDEMLKDVDFEKFRFKPLFSSEFYYLKNIRFREGILLLTGSKDISVEEFQRLSSSNPGLTWVKYCDSKAIVNTNDYINLCNRIAGSELFLLRYAHDQVFESFRNLSICSRFTQHFAGGGEVLFVLSSMLTHEFMPRYLALFDKPEMIKPEMVMVEGDLFLMGSENSEFSDEEPVHPVKLSTFQISKFPVTNIQFVQFIKETGYQTSAEKGRWSFAAYWDTFNEKSVLTDKINVFCNWQFDEWGTPYGRERDHYPVIHVSWFDAIAYCNYLNKISGYPSVYNDRGNLLDPNGNITEDISKVKGYRLPTEAEWEFAAKGGKKSKGFKYSGSNEPTEVANCWESEQYILRKVGSLAPNELGLWDMSGNVWEWCNDFYDSDFYSKCSELGEVENPCCLSEATLRVLRGGSWVDGAVDCRLARRNAFVPLNRDASAGFRVVFVP